MSAVEENWNEMANLSERENAAGALARPEEL